MFIVAVVRRRLYRRLWGVLAVALALIPIAVAETARPLLDDGPFHGRARADCPTRAPDASFTVASGYQLDTFDATAGETAPTVRLRTGAGKTRWCIHAHGNQGAHVRSVRFREQSRGILGSVVLTGTVDWTYGRERMSWYLGPRGGLRDYYYSW